MRDYEIFLRLLAARVYTARLASGLPIRDVSDFHIWLEECAARAAKSNSLEEFFAGLD